MDKSQKSSEPVENDQAQEVQRTEQKELINQKIASETGHSQQKQLDFQTNGYFQNFTTDPDKRLDYIHFFKENEIFKGQITFDNCSGCNIRQFYVGHQSLFASQRKRVLFTSFFSENIKSKPILDWPFEHLNFLENSYSQNDEEDYLDKFYQDQKQSIQTTQAKKKQQKKGPIKKAPNFFCHDLFTFSFLIEDKKSQKQTPIQQYYYLKLQKYVQAQGFSLKLVIKDNFKIKMAFQGEDLPEQSTTIQKPVGLYKKQLVQKILNERNKFSFLFYMKEPYQKNQLSKLINYQQVLQSLKKETCTMKPTQKKDQYIFLQGDLENCYFYPALHQIIKTCRYVLDDIELEILINSQKQKGFLCFLILIDGIEVPVFSSMLVLVNDVKKYYFKYGHPNRHPKGSREEKEQKYFLKGLFLEKILGIAFQKMKYLKEGRPQEIFMTLAKSCSKTLRGGQIKKVHQYIQRSKNAKQGDLKHMFVFSAPDLFFAPHHPNYQSYQQGKNFFNDSLEDYNNWYQQIEINQEKKIIKHYKQKWPVKKLQTRIDFVKGYIEQCLKIEEQTKIFLKDLIKQKIAHKAFKHSYSFHDSIQINGKKFFIITDLRNINNQRDREDEFPVKWNRIMSKKHNIQINYGKISQKESFKKYNYQTFGNRNDEARLQSHQILISQKEMQELGWQITVAYKYNNYHLKSTQAILQWKRQKYYKIKLAELKPFFVVLNQKDKRFEEIKYKQDVPPQKKNYLPIRLQMVSDKYEVLTNQQFSWLFYSDQKLARLPPQVLQRKQFIVVVSIDQDVKDPTENMISLISASEKDSIQLYADFNSKEQKKFAIELKQKMEYDQGKVYVSFEVNEAKQMQQGQKSTHFKGAVAAQFKQQFKQKSQLLQKQDFQLKLHKLAFKKEQSGKQSQLQANDNFHVHILSNQQQIERQQIYVLQFSSSSQKQTFQNISKVYHALEKCESK